MKIQTGVKAHDDVCQTAEMTRQVAVAAASSQAAVTTAELTYYRAIRNSARTNGLPGVGDFNTVIIQLGGKP